MSTDHVRCPEQGIHPPHGVVAKHGAYWCPGEHGKAAVPLPEFGGIPRSEWFCGVHGVEKTGPAGVCLCGDAPPIHSQEEFLTALDVLLDHTLHADECYIDAAQTECVCVIGKVRAALPPCGAIQPKPFGEWRDRTVKVYRCTRNAHPASPDRHTFG